MVSENLVNSFWDLVNGFCSKQRTSYKEANAPPNIYIYPILYPNNIILCISTYISRTSDYNIYPLNVASTYIVYNLFFTSLRIVFDSGYTHNWSTMLALCQDAAHRSSPLLVALEGLELRPRSCVVNLMIPIKLKDRITK